MERCVSEPVGYSMGTFPLCTRWYGSMPTHLTKKFWLSLELLYLWPWQTKQSLPTSLRTLPVIVHGSPRFYTVLHGSPRFYGSAFYGSPLYIHRNPVSTALDTPLRKNS